MTDELWMPSGNARLAGVMGWPISHSLSPRLHGTWIRRHRLDAAYVPLAVRPDDLAEALRVLPRTGFVGFNLTLPHKEAALEICDTVDDAARRIGAVNTIIVGEDGRLAGQNTDGIGFLESVRAHPGGAAALGGNVAVVLGAGGAARAVGASLLDAGCACVRIVNRSADRAEALAATLGGGAEAWPWVKREAALADAGLLVNTTSLGMVGQPALDLTLKTLPPEAVVLDIVYVPLETPLLAAARARGNLAIDGLGMLLHQARPGFRAWFGVDPQVDDGLRNTVLAALHERTPA